MEITEIKEQLNIIEVATHLGIIIDPKTSKALCPFHPDKTPSLQFSKEKQICTCFSSNCDLGTVDMIGLTERRLQNTTHETLKYLSELAGAPANQNGSHTHAVQEPEQYKKVAMLQKAFSYFESTFLASKPAKDYATGRNLNIKTLTIGYNTGTFHHNEKSQGDSQLIETYVQLGLLTKTNSGYTSFGLGSLVFALRDKQSQVTGLYFRAVEPRPSKFKGRSYEKHLYLKNRQGLYPKYPEQETQKLILTESIVDAATLLSIADIKSNYEILALYGTNGLTVEIKQAIRELEQLEEVILFFDGDAAGKSAVANNGSNLKELLPKIKISVVNTLENEDINSIAVGHSSEIFTQLLSERTAFFFSAEKQKTTSTEEKKEGKTIEAPQEPSGLNTTNPNKIIYITATANYYIKGGIRKDLDSLKVTLVIEHLVHKAKSRNKLDLYEDKQTERVAREASEKLDLRPDLIERDMNILTDLLDQYREENSIFQKRKKRSVLSS